jgi:ATP-dependent DNA helicase RecQ
VCHAEWGDGVVMSIEQDRMTVLFDEVGYKMLSLRAVHERNLLTSTKDPAPAPDV